MYLDNYADSKKAFGRWVREHRVEAGLDVSDLAEELVGAAESSGRVGEDVAYAKLESLIRRVEAGRGSFKEWQCAAIAPLVVPNHPEDLVFNQAVSILRDRGANYLFELKERSLEALLKGVVDFQQAQEQVAAAEVRMLKEKGLDSAEVALIRWLRGARVSERFDTWPDAPDVLPAEHRFFVDLFDDQTPPGGVRAVAALVHGFLHQLHAVMQLRLSDEPRPPVLAEAAQNDGFLSVMVQWSLLTPANQRRSVDQFVAFTEAVMGARSDNPDVWLEQVKATVDTEVRALSSQILETAMGAARDSIQEHILARMSHRTGQRDDPSFDPNRGEPPRATTEAEGPGGRSAPASTAGDEPG